MVKYEYFIEKHLITKDNEVYDGLAGRCGLSNNVFNEGLYVMRQHYFLKTNQHYTDVILPEIQKKCLSYNDVQKYLSEHSENYSNLSANAAQLTVRKLTNSFSSFYGLLKLKKSGEYEKEVNMPNYKKSGGLFVVTYNKQALEGTYNKLNKIVLPKTNIELPIKVLHWDTMTQISLVPKYGAIEIHVCYRVPVYTQEPEEKTEEKVEETIKETPIENKTDVDNVEENSNTEETEKVKNVMGIDLGVDNLATCVSNVFRSFIIDGHPIKNINHFYNKIRAEEYSKLDNQINKKTWKEINSIKYSKELSEEEKKSKLYFLYKKIIRTTNRLEQVSLRRRNFINDYFHKASSYIVNQAVKYKIQTIFIGLNKQWKQETNMGKVNNQNFVSIPHSTLIEMIKYKAKRHNIEVVVIEESYTSKASFLNNDEIYTYGQEPAEMNFSGYRAKRGLYKIKGCKTIINADVNGAFNIMRKGLNVNSDVLKPRVNGYVFCPEKVTLLLKPKKKAKKILK